MIDVLSGRALVARFAADPVEVPAIESVRERLESLISHLPAAEAFTVVEHLFGVRPLVEAFFEPREALVQVASGLQVGLLGLFTPTPELRWCAAAVEGEASGAGLLLRGKVRIPSPTADGSLVLVQMPGREHRLAWLDHGTRGVERHGSRTGGPVRSDSPCWLAVEGAAVGPDLLSRPVTLAPGDAFYRRLETYAGIWSLAAALCARDGVRALRRAARTTAYRGRAFSASQVVAMGITGVEIAAELTAAAAQRHLAFALDEPAPHGGLILAAAAARTLDDLALKTAELRHRVGLAVDGPFGEEGSAKILTTFLGGALMLESEVGHALGIPAQETGG